MSLGERPTCDLRFDMTRFPGSGHAAGPSTSAERDAVNSISQKALDTAVNDGLLDHAGEGHLKKKKLLL